MSDLYVLQNHLGLIKIGRSKNYKIRLGRIERDDLCKVELVSLLKDKGSEEQEYLSHLKRYNICGEWFEGHEEARKKIADLLCEGLNTDWPFKLAHDDLVDEWCDLIEAHRHAISVSKLSQRFIRKMENSYEQDGSCNLHCDRKIGQIIWEYDEGNSYLTTGEEIDGVDVTLVYLNDIKLPFPLPTFTTDVSDALLTWPESKRPLNWSGTAWDCCIEGLKARRRDMMAKY